MRHSTRNHQTHHEEASGFFVIQSEHPPGHRPEKRKLSGADFRAQGPDKTGRAIAVAGDVARTRQIPPGERPKVISLEGVSPARFSKPGLTMSIGTALSANGSKIRGKIRQTALYLVT